MSTTPEPLRFERESRNPFILFTRDGNQVRIEGPRRNEIAKQILAMDKAVEALKAIERMAGDAGASEMPDYRSALGAASEAARETLKQFEA